MATERYRVQSLARGLRLLSEIATSDGDISAAVLSENTGLSRQTVYHLLHTLRQAGYVEQHSGALYRLGWGVKPLAEGYGSQVRPPREALESLERLAQRTGETCSLSVWSGEDVVLIAQVPGRRPVRVADVEVGQRGSIHARAAGKALLAHADAVFRADVLRDLVLTPLTENTLTDRNGFEREIEHIGEQGWALDREEFAIGVTCVAAVATIDVADFALSILAPTSRFREHADSYRKLLMEVVSELNSPASPEAAS